MRLNPTAVPVFALAAVLFLVGSSFEKKTVSRAARIRMFAVSILLALPGFLCALYYAHRFDNASWFYSFRTLPYSELVIAGSGLFAGALNSWFGPETSGSEPRYLPH